MLNKLKLNVKLIGAFAIVSVITLIVGLVGWFGINSLEKSLLNVSDNTLPAISSMLVVSEAQTAVKAAARTLLIPGIDEERIQRQIKATESAWDRIDEHWKIYEDTYRDSTEDALWRTFVPLWNEWKQGAATFDKLNAEYLKAKDPKIYAKMYDQAININYASFTASEAALNKIIDYNTEVSKKEEEKSKETSKLVTTLVTLSMIIGTGLAIGLGVLLSFSISKPILAVVNSLNESSAQVSSASEQLSATSQQLAEGNSEQASSLEETSSTLEEASSMIYQNSENTKQAATLSAQAKAAADMGNLEMSEMLTSIDEIKKSSDEISRIIKVIDDIAFLTNILALNAAVEAARAGEAGMGFAVVAEEVRNLAQRSAQAAKDTAALIERNVEMSNKGVDVTKRVGKSLLDITAQAKKVNELMDEVAAASQEQTQGIQQINKAIAQMEVVTQENASSAEESASTAEELSAQAMNLTEIVQELAALVNGNSDNKLSRTQMYKSNKMPIKTAKASSNNIKNIHHGAKFETNKKTRIINPEDIIPLEQDKMDF